MARVTVEDCIQIVPNRFELVLLASQRARDIAAGMPLTLDRDNDKNPVVALREIADQTVDFEELRRHIVRGVNRHADFNLEDDELLGLSQQGIETIEGFGGESSIRELEFEGEAEAAPEDTSPESALDDENPEPDEQALAAVQAEAMAEAPAQEIPEGGELADIAADLAGTDDEAGKA